MKKIFDFLSLIRIGNLCMIALSISLFYYLILVPAHHNYLYTTLLPFTGSEFILFVLSVLMIAAAGNIINDYFDFELDKHFKPKRPLAKATFSLDTAMYLHAVFVFLGVGLGFYLSYHSGKFQLGYVYIVCAMLLYLYSAYLKKVPVVGNIVVATLTGFVFFLLLLFEANFLYIITFDQASYVLNILLMQALFYGGFAFMTNLIRELVKDLEDMEGDAEFNHNTFPVAFGTSSSKILVGVLTVLLLFGLTYFQKMFLDGQAMKQFFYLLIAVQVPLAITIPMLMRAQTNRDYARISLLLKFIMLLGILSIPAFYLFNRLAA